VWPEETHGAELAPFRTASEIIDWSVPPPSIFDPKRRKLAENTLRRIADGVQRYVVDAKEPFIVRHGHYFAGKKTTFRGQPLSRPLGTICATNDKNIVVPSVRPAGTEGPGSPEAFMAAYMLKQNGTPGTPGYVVGHDLHRPIGTIHTKDTHGLVTAFLIKYYSSGTKNHQALTEPIHTIPSHDRFGLVEIHGEPYEITDIGMRMLTPRELFNGQGFPSDYIIDGKYTNREGEQKRLTKQLQTAMAGNSVPPVMSYHLARANMQSVRAD
jgi:DNA (cytosine-5)-methyltransferase 1